jgi:HSP20 family protein
MQNEKIRISPEICSYVDDIHSKLTIEVALPGVAKKNINLNMHEDSFNIAAPRSDNDTIFTTTMAFCCPVSPEKAEAMYENGLLRIKVPFKEAMEDALSIPVN